MSDKNINQIYKYEEMSNKVLRADRRLQDSHTNNIQDAADAAPKSLAGRITMADIGTRAVEADADELNIAKRGTEKRRTAVTKTSKTSSRSTLLDTEIEKLEYYPRSEETTMVYELIVNWCSQVLGDDIPHSVIVSAADLVIGVLCDAEMTAINKQKSIEKDLEVKLSNESFAEVLGLSQRLVDYGKLDDDEGAGVAVLSEDEQSSEEDVESEPEEQVEALDVTESSDTVGAEDDNEKGRVLIYDVDEFYLQRELAKYLKEDTAQLQALGRKIYNLLAHMENKRQLENELMEVLEFEHFELVEHLMKNKSELVWGIKLASSDNKDTVLDEMKQLGLNILADQYTNREDGSHSSKKRKLAKKEENLVEKREPQIVNLSDLTFEQGSHLMTASKVSLPENSFKRLKPNYEEIHVPAPPKPTQETELVPIADLPEWCQDAFPSAETSTLNRVQSEVYPIAFQEDENMLLCAPTGAGKTNVAMLATLRCMSHFRNDDGSFDLANFKVVFLAPLKALVQEQVREFERRLHQYGVKVEELTGDSNLSKQQILETQILVCTPEKWDVITRKHNPYTDLVKLIIIDEIHLLHDERGPVLESIVARTLRKQTSTRLVGLSATLPNYHDVAKFMRVDRGLFYFDASYRPCPLAQQYCGVKEKNSFKKVQAMNEVCYDKIIESVTAKHQVIVFVHSRKDTVRTAQWLRDKLREEEKLQMFQKSDAGSRQVLKEEAEKVKNEGLRDLIQNGFAVHHAGLSREDRSLSEDLFAEGLVQVLVSTATLAWGVNLPAHTVIIKGTEVYSPEKGDWTQLSPQDVLQMLGRAGRPRYDVNGEGIIITNQSEVQYYLAVLNQQLPIESQMMSKLVDSLNAEIVLGTVKSLEDAIQWMGYTYLYVRMLRSPDLYNVTKEENDDSLYWRRADLAHTALSILHRNNLVVYDGKRIQSTELGRISSHFYITHDSVAMYNKQLKPHLSQIELLKIFAMSDEFKYIPVRQEEKMEITKLLEKAPIPVKETAEDPKAKVNVLLQSFISRLRLDGFALNADMIYITQSAARLFRALYEICLKKQWARLSKLLLNMCKSIDKRIWMTNSPFRQFPGCPTEIIQRSEASPLPWSEYFNLTSAAEVGQAIRSDKFGKKAFELLSKFPRLSMKCTVQPITPSLMRFELEVLPDFVWDDELHGYAQNFLLIVEDNDGAKILYTDHLVVKKSFVGQEHLVDFTVPVSDPLPPNFFVTLVSDRWMHCECRVPVVFNNVLLPKKFPAPTPLIDMEPVPTSELKVEEFVELFEFTEFNKFQSQTFHALYNTDDNVLIGVSKGSGKTVMAELAILNHWTNKTGRAVYICPTQEKINTLYKEWSKKFASLEKSVGKFTNDMTLNLSILAENHLVLATPQQLDSVTRRWKQRKNVQNIELVIADDVHKIDNATYENVLSRMRFISTQIPGKRIVALGTSMAPSKDLSGWLGCSTVFNFAASEKTTPLQIHMTSEETIPEFDEPCIIFVSTRKEALQTAQSLMSGESLLKTEAEEIEPYLNRVSDGELVECLTQGIGLYYKNMAASDRNIVDKLFEYGALSYLIATKETMYFAPSCGAVVVKGTQYYETKEHRFVNYSLNDILEMVGLSSKVVISTTNREYYKKFISESLPVESFLHYALHDAMMNEVSNGIITSKQDCIDWLTYTYFYRRLQGNPSFYGVKDLSHMGLSAYLTELVEDTLKELQDAQMIEVDEDDISPLNGSVIAAYYDVSFVSMQTFSMSLSRKSKLKSIFECVTAAAEFDTLPVRDYERNSLLRLYSKCPLKTNNVDTSSPFFKAFVLLQCHISRMELPVELAADQLFVLEKVLQLLSAIVDVLSGEGYLNATLAMDLSQMITQAMWDTESPLKQIPFMEGEILENCSHLTSVYDLMSLEDDERMSLLTLPNKQLNKVAQFINKYPNVELSYEATREDIVVTLTRDEEPDDLLVESAHYPFEKLENWWVIVGDTQTRTLYAIKKMRLSKEVNQCAMELSLPEGEQNLTIWAVCDSYLDADKEVSFVV